MTDPHVPAPKDDRISAAKADFKRMILWIALAGIVVTAAALWYLSLFGPLRTHLVVATGAGVFVSVMLGCGLRSEERGVGQECVSTLSARGSPSHKKKKQNT